jgi:hypothetical protein
LSRTARSIFAFSNIILTSTTHCERAGGISPQGWVQDGQSEPRHERRDPAHTRHQTEHLAGGRVGRTRPRHLGLPVLRPRHSPYDWRHP